MADYPRWQASVLQKTLTARRVVLLTGPRQCGKTTLARHIASEKTLYRTLDDVAARQAAEQDPHLFVDYVPEDGTLIIDEIQKVPDLLSAIKKVVDQNNRAGQFLITGSANILSLPTVTDSLAGRIGRLRLRPLSQGEIAGSQPCFLDQAFSMDFSWNRPRYTRDDLIAFMFRGGFPEPMRLEGKNRRNWHVDYTHALITHDLKDVANIRHADVMKALIKILAAWSSKQMDVSAIGAGLAADRRTLAHYLGALRALYIVDSVPPWRKTDYDRIGKQEKFFMVDTGMMTALLGWSPSDLPDDPDKPGKIFETFAYHELSAQIEASETHYDLSHYRDREKREIDFLITREDGRILAIDIKSGITVKSSDFKHITWFQETCSKKKPTIGLILYAGQDILPFGKNLWAVPFESLWRT